MNQVLVHVGATLIHSLWESAVIWLVLRASLRVLRHSSASLRYACGCTALGGAMLVPIATFAWIQLVPHAPSAAVPFAYPDQLAAAAQRSSSPQPDGPSRGDLVLTALVAAWGLGCILKLAALARDFGSARRLARSELDPLPQRQRALWESMVGRLKLRRPVRAGISPAVLVPSVVGWLKPVVLFPVSALTGLSDSQVESLFAHELAHIQRHDFVVNLFQSICETLYFFNPAALAISHCIRVERENACDDVAVGAVGDPRGLALALAHLEETRQAALALAASGHRQLLPRIQRLIAGSGGLRKAPPASFAAASLALVYLGIFALIPVVAGGLRAESSSAISPGFVAHGTGTALASSVDAAARAWLEALDAGQYDLAYSGAGIWLRAQSTEWDGLPPRTMEKWKRMGRCTQRVVSKEAQFEKNPRGSFQGEFASIEYRATYELGGAKREVVTFQKEPDGNWRVNGFSLGDPRD